MDSKVALRNKFIDDNAHLFWYIKKDALHDISDEVLVEFIMNYAELDQIKRLFEVVGEKKLKSIYSGLKGRQVFNYFPEVYNFFGLLVKRYA